MHRVFRIVAMAAILATLATLFLVSPAKAAVAGCNSNSPVGAEIYQITPSGSFTRNIYAKICLVYDNNSVYNSTKIYCRTDNNVGCDIRAEVLSARLDRFYAATGDFQSTLSNQWFQADELGYHSSWGWAGNDNPTSFTGYRFQARDNDIRVRFGFDGQLRNLGDAWSARVALVP